MKEVLSLKLKLLRKLLLKKLEIDNEVKELEFLKEVELSFWEKLLEDLR